MKTLSIKQTPTSFFLPAADLLAVWNATSSEETRYYLRGVYCETQMLPNADRPHITMTATDGHILMSAAIEDESAFIGAECSTQGDDKFGRGFIMATDTAEKAFKAKAWGDAWIYGDTKTGILQIVDMPRAKDPLDEELRRLGVCEFERIDGTFPDWRRVLPAEKDNTAPAAFNMDLLDRFRKAAQTYARANGKPAKDPAVRLHPGDGTGPIKLELPAVPHMTGVLMPLRWENAVAHAA